jgi:iron complex transport system substrate-binding protein
VSLVPSATEILFALGAGDEVVGVTYACDWPPEARRRRVVVWPRFRTEGLRPEEVDAIVREAYRQGKSLYMLDVQALSELRPDLIVAQGLCEVCAAAPGSVEDALRRLSHPPKLLTLHPHSLDDVLRDIETLGEAVGRMAEARILTDEMRSRIKDVRDRARDLPRRRTFFMEWVFPPFSSGHWVPEMIGIAGGLDLGSSSHPSRRVSPDEVLGHQPEIVIVGPCGYRLDRAAEEAKMLVEEGWIRETPAFYGGRIYAVDASRYFSRHGVGIAHGVEILAEIIHPEAFRGVAPSNTYRRVEAW